MGGWQARIGNDKERKRGSRNARTPRCSRCRSETFEGSVARGLESAGRGGSEARNGEL